MSYAVSPHSCAPNPAYNSVLNEIIVNVDTDKPTLSKRPPAQPLQVVASLVESYGAAGPAVFIAMYATCAVLLFPGGLLSVIAGYLFGKR